jgi:hypothetical protein
MIWPSSQMAYSGIVYCDKSGCSGRREEGRWYTQLGGSDTRRSGRGIYLSTNPKKSLSITASILAHASPPAKMPTDTSTSDVRITIVDPTAWQTQAREWKLEHGIEIYLQPDKLVEVKRKTTEKPKKTRDSITCLIPRRELCPDRRWMLTGCKIHGRHKLSMSRRDLEKSRIG